MADLEGKRVPLFFSTVTKNLMTICDCSGAVVLMVLTLLKKMVV